MGSEGNYNRLYKEAAIEAAGDTPVIFLAPPSQSSVSEAEYKEYLAKTLSPYTQSTEDVNDVHDTMLTWYNEDNYLAASSFTTDQGTKIDLVTILPDGESYKNFLAKNLNVNHLYGSEEMWATFVGAHEGKHIFQYNDTSNPALISAPTLTREDNADVHAINVVAEKYNLSPEETQRFQFEVNKVRAINSILSPKHSTHITPGDNTLPEHIGASDAFSALVHSAIEYLAQENSELESKMNILKSNQDYKGLGALINEQAVKLLKAGALDDETNPLIQKLTHDFLEAYDHFNNNPHLKTLDGKPVLDGNGNAIQIGSDASNDPSASADPNLFKTPASSPAHINTATNNMEPNSVKSLSGEFLAKGAANGEGSPSVRVIPKNEQDAVLAENNPSPTLAPAA